MSGDISIDVGSAVPYAVDRVLALFGRDELTRAARERLEKQVRIALEQASLVQCVGMDTPIPLNQIYQRALLRPSQTDSASGSVDLLELIDQGANAVILGLPGAGKTTLLHWAFLNLIQNKAVVPLMFTLRRPDAISDLRAFVADVSTSRVFRKGHERLVVLVDGYDEIDVKERKDVSLLLQEFASLQRGPFIVTCRLYYTVVDLKARYLYVEPFSSDQAEAFVRSFFKAYGVKHNAREVIAELQGRGFADFLGSPLMLALVCILKSGPLPQLPRNSIGLVRRAIDTLTFRWDEQKGIARGGQIPIDGEERVRCLMRIAYHFEKPIGPEATAIRYAQQHLKYAQRMDIAPTAFLMVIAQWYGIFVPVSDGQWTFVHRTVHDFLAARYWVETGAFSDVAITNTQWNTRAAYAACLIPDATRCLVKSLQKGLELHVLVECLANNAAFDAKEVAKAVVQRYGIERFGKRVGYERSIDTLFVALSEDFFHLVSDEFLDALVEAGTFNVSKAHDVVAALALSELLRRGRKARLPIRRDLADVSFRVRRGDLDIGPFRAADVLY